MLPEKTGWSRVNLRWIGALILVAEEGLGYHTFSLYNSACIFRKGRRFSKSVLKFGRRICSTFWRIPRSDGWKLVRKLRGSSFPAFRYLGSRTSCCPLPKLAGSQSTTNWRKPDSALESACESRGRVNSRRILSASVRQQILTGGDTVVLDGMELAAVCASIGTRPPQTNDADAFFPATNTSSWRQISSNARLANDGAEEEAMVGWWWYVVWDDEGEEEKKKKGLGEDFIHQLLPIYRM